jgi:hypothetical protein
MVSSGDRSVRSHTVTYYRLSSPGYLLTRLGKRAAGVSLFLYDTPVRLTAGLLTDLGFDASDIAIVIRAELRRVIQTAMRVWPD